MPNLKDLKKYTINSSIQDKIFLFHGEPGTRKTTVATGDKESTLLLATEQGYKFISDIYKVDINSWYEIKDMVRQLDDPDNKARFKTIAIDTISIAFDLCVSYICSKNGVAELSEVAWGQGYAQVKKEFAKVINSIPQKGYGLVMISHSVEKDDEKNGYSVKVDLDKRPSAIIKGLADFILFTKKEIKDDTENELTVYAYSGSQNTNIEVKTRARYFPRRFEFTYPNLLLALDEAIQKQKEIEGIEITDNPDFSIYNSEKVDLKKIQNEVMNLAKELLEINEEEVIKTLESGLKGVKISETNVTHIETLIAIKESLLDMKRGL